MNKNKDLSQKDKKTWEDYIKDPSDIYDKDNKIIEGNPDKIKFVTDSWKFTKNINNKSPNWYLSEIISQ